MSEMKIGSKTDGCFDSATEKDEPDDTSPKTSPMISRRREDSAVSRTSDSASSSGTPAFCSCSRWAYVGKWHLASGGSVGDHATKPVPPHLRGGYRDYWVASDVLEFTSHSYDGHMFDGEGRRREFPAGRYRTDAVTDFALEFLQTRSHDRPFFLFLSHIEPHHQNDHRAYEGPLAEGMLFERRTFHAAFALADKKEGMSAFVEKRKPDFKNR